jgi:hypothetical protein
MKRLTAVCMMLLMLMGCGAPSTPVTTAQNTARPPEPAFLVGYSKQDITPKESVPLRGSGNTSMRMSQGVLDYLYVTCTALTDEKGTTALLFTIDNSGSQAQVITPIREKVSKETGVPVELISVSATHTHSGPDLVNGKEDSMRTYRRQLQDQMLLAAKEALADRLPATMEIATVETENMTFVRRYFLENGTLAGENYGDFKSSPIARHETEADNNMQLIRFRRSGGKDVLLANFQAHPTRVLADPACHKEISADFVGIFRSEVERNLDCHVAYFTGASGNLRVLSRIKEENRSNDYKEHGKLLAEYVQQAVYTPAATGDICVLLQTYVGRVNHSEDHLLVYASQVFAYWQETNDKEGSEAMGRPNGIESPHHAGAIVAKAKLGETMSFEISVLSIGNVGFVMTPYEMFDTNGMEIKTGSPFPMTFVLTCTNDSLVYVPSALGYQNGGYEVHQARLVPGSGEELAQQYIIMLQEVYSET